MARRFTIEGARVLVVEKCTDILDGASKGNSAILHTGFDAPPDSLEQACVAAGYDEYLAIRDSLKLPLLKTGALLLAWNEEEEAKLDGILEHAHRNGVHGAHLLSTGQVLAREPHLSVGVRAGISVPGEFVVDPWTAPFVYMLQALENGASLVRNCEVLGGEFDGDSWLLQTTQGVAKGTAVINCSGLYGDHVDQCLVGASDFEIRPRKGQFLVYDKSASRFLQSIILPVPTAITKGIVVCRTIFGNVLVGPTAEDQDSRDDASVVASTLESLRGKGERILPPLATQSITATYAGIRPATESKEYRVRIYNEKNYVCVGGIRSTGLSSALGIARYVFDRFPGRFPNPVPSDSLLCPTVNQIAENEVRDWQKPGNGGIVCHCELVTRRELQQALEGRIPCASPGALKRRTRITMGRCQGFYCTAELSELTRGRFDSDPE